MASLLASLLKKQLDNTQITLPDDLDALSEDFQEYFDTLSSPDEKAEILQALSQALVGSPKLIGHWVDSQYHCGLGLEAIDSNNLYLEKLIQCPKLLRFFAEQLSNISEKAANKNIQCIPLRGTKRINFTNISRDSDNLSFARHASYYLYYQLRFFEKKVQNTDGSEKVTRPFNDICLEVAARKRAKVYFEQRRHYWQSTKPLKTLLRDIIIKHKNSNGMNITHTATRKKSRKLGSVWFKTKKNVISQLKWRRRWLYLSQFGQDKETVANKRSVLKELMDTIKSVEKPADVITPTEILNKINEWKASKKTSVDATQNSPVLEDENEGKKLFETEAASSEKVVPAELKVIRSSFHHRLFGGAPRASKTEKLIIGIENSLKSVKKRYGG